MSGRKTIVILVASVLAAGVAVGVAALRGPPRPATMDERIHAVASTLRCPVCQNLSVADSPSGLASEMRRRIGERLREGDTPTEIRAGFAAAYGRWILQAPPKEGFNLVAWLAAPAALLAGGILAAVAIRRWRRRRPTIAVASSDGLSPADRVLLERAAAQEELG